MLALILFVSDYQRDFICTYEGCGKKFTRKEHLTRHHISHTRDFQHRCAFPGCGRLFLSSYHLKRHIATHDYSCKICPSLTFESREMLLNHRRIIHDVKTYRCKYRKLSVLQLKLISITLFPPEVASCGKICQSSYDLDCHRRTHGDLNDCHEYAT